MITIFHGDNIVKSRDALLALKKRHADLEVIKLSDPIDITTITQAAESKTLFGNDRMVIIENLLTDGRAKKSQNIIKYLAYGDLSTHIVLWETKTVSRHILKQFSSANIRHFKLDAVLFRFLESIMPGDEKRTLLLFHSLVVREPVELVSFMITRQIRLLLAVSTNSKIPEVKRLASWQKAKLTRQAGKFREEQLIWMMKQLYQIEYRQKKGLSGLSWIAELDILLTDNYDK